MTLFGWELTRTKAAVGRTNLPTASYADNWNLDTVRGGWFGLVREGFAGAWQRGVSATVEDMMAHSTAWACITLIAADIAKMRFYLVAEDADGIETEVTNSAYSPVLRKPNHYQNRIQFFMQWILSKLTRGNTYVLKERDGAGKVAALYILDPARVRVLVSPAGDVFYALQADALAGLTDQHLIVPAREIIHDLMFPLYHPLVGVSPIHACGRAVKQGLEILKRSEEFFANGSNPAGVLTAPSAISNEVAERVQKHWDENFSGQRNVGKVAVLGDGLKYEALSMTAVDAQLIEQLKWGDERVCSVFHVPPYMVAVAVEPRFNNVEALNSQYYTQCVQVLVESIELCLEEGLELKAPYGIEGDIDNLLRMDSATKMTTAKDGVAGGILAPNEARARFNLPPKPGGESPYLQEQNYSLEALQRRDAAAAAPPSLTPAPPMAPPMAGPAPDPNVEAAYPMALFQKLLTVDWSAIDAGA